MSTRLKPGYKQTEAGMIPEEWNLEPLGYHVEIRSGESPSRFRFASDGIPYFKVEQLNNNRKYLRDTPYFVGDTTKVARGSLIFAKRGAAILLNKIRILAADSFMDTNLMTLTPKPSISDAFLYYALTHIELWRIADTTSIPQINNKHIIPLLLPIPPTRAEQEAIAEALSNADALIESLERLIAKKRDLKQAVMQELLTGRKRLPGFSGQWQTNLLGDCGDVIMGQSPPGTSYNRTGAGTPLINGPTEFTDRHPIKIQWTTLPARFCKHGDLLICVRGSSTGRTNYANDAYAIGRGVAAIRAKNNNDTRYLSYQVISAVNGILTAATGSTFPSVDGASFRKIVVPIPSPDEQCAIADILSDMEVEIASLDTKLSKAHHIKQGMMQELLTGRTRLI